MRIWSGLMKAAALALLLIAASDVLVIDTAFPALCSANSSGPSSTQTAPQPADGDCYCCCSHIVLTSPVPQAVVLAMVERTSPPPISRFRNAELPDILHPPRV